MINNQTRLYVSLAQRPGNFGATVFNALFKFHGVNALYLPRAARGAEQAPALVQALRELGVAGCGVSMPLKEAVAALVDGLEGVALDTMSVNTIVRMDSGRLIGHNTDVAGVVGALKGGSFKRVLIYGAGGVVRSIVAACRELGVAEIHLTSRRPAQAGKLAGSLGVLAWSPKATETFDLAINATPASQEPETHEIYRLAMQASTLFDLVVSPHDTRLVAHARSRGLRVVTGMTMAKFQLVRQFELYTGISPDLAEVDRIIAQDYVGAGHS